MITSPTVALPVAPMRRGEVKRLEAGRPLEAFGACRREVGSLICETSSFISERAELRSSAVGFSEAPTSGRTVTWSSLRSSRKQSSRRRPAHAKGSG
eukprot:scaffold2654_cov76-Phaeocystis_antarctica.AAC.1